MGLATAYLVAGSTTSGDASNPLVAYGLLGIILVAFTFLLISGKLVVGREHDRVVAENDEYRKAMPDMVSALKDSTQAIKEGAQVQRDTLVLLEVRKRERDR